MNASFAEELKKARTDMNLTQEELAQRLNISRPMISHWEHGRALPDIEMLRRISVELNYDFFSDKSQTAADDPPAEDIAVAPAIDETPKKGRRLPLIICLSILALITLAVGVLLVNSRQKQASEALIAVIPSESVAYLEYDETFLEHYGWHICFIVENRGNIAFIPDHAVITFYQNGHVSGILNMDNDYIQNQMDDDTLTMDGNHLELYFGSNHLNDDRAGCTIYGKDINGIDCSFYGEISLSKEHRTQ